MSNIRAVILCGGSGKRLWPLSRESYPKQFSHLVSNNETMFQASIRRVLGSGALKPILLTGNEYRFIVGEQLESIGVTDHDIIIEPSGRNTAPAIAAAALRIQKTDPNAIMVVSPADHQIHDDNAFSAALEIAVEQAEKGDIVTFGIVPDRAATGYGYIEVETKIENIKTSVPFKQFLEKPDKSKAQKMLKTGKFLWNSGIFVFSASAILAAFEKHAPSTLSAVRRSVDEGRDDLDFFRLSDAFNKADDISIDYAIMEHVTGQVVPLDCGWNDLGSWRTVWLESDKDKNGVATKGSVSMHNCEDSLLRSEDDKMHMVGIGLKNIVAVAMRDAVLVTDMSNSQSVSDSVALMRKEDIYQADEFPRAARPWGWYETLTKHSRFRVKSIVVKPGQKLSLQSHVHRAEHWIVVEGTAKVTINDEVKMVTENESVFIPLGAKHRMENPGKMDMHLVEVQTGSYLEEDDIIRYEDIYDRNIV